MMVYIKFIVAKVYLLIWNYLLMFMFNFKSLLLILISLTLAGCGLKEKSISQICEEAPGICNDLHVIGDCRYNRTSLIRARYNHLQESNDKNIKTLLEELDAYKVCLAPTLQIAYKRYKDRKQKRLDNYLASQKVIDQLLKDSVGTQDPNLAYYLWTNFNDLQAKKVFLASAKQPNLTDPSVLAKLAVYYSADETQKSLDFYYKALRESRSIEELPSNIFLQLVSFFFRTNKYEEAYIWAKVTLDTADDDDELPPINLDLIVDRGFITEDMQSELDTKVDMYIEALEDGVFKEQAPQYFQELPAQ